MAAEAGYGEGGWVGGHRRWEEAFCGYVNNNGVGNGNGVDKFLYNSQWEEVED